MKSLVESLFDSDLVSKDTGLEWLYGLVKYAKVFSDSNIDFLNKLKIHKEFNVLSKKFKMRDWNPNSLLSMAKPKNDPIEETLRELFYVIVTKIPSNKTKNKNALRNAIFKVVADYTDLKIGDHVNIVVSNSDDIDNALKIAVYFQKDRGWNYLDRLGYISMTMIPL